MRSLRVESCRNRSSADVYVALYIYVCSWFLRESLSFRILRGRRIIGSRVSLWSLPEEVKRDALLFSSDRWLELELRRGWNLISTSIHSLTLQGASLSLYDIHTKKYGNTLSKKRASRSSAVAKEANWPLFNLYRVENCWLLQKVRGYIYHSWNKLRYARKVTLIYTYISHSTEQFLRTVTNNYWEIVECQPLKWFSLIFGELYLRLVSYLELYFSFLETKLLHNTMQKFVFI